jgi:hypothetical protein
MTRIRIITLALAAVFCLSAVTASGAFAAVKKGEISTSLTEGKVPTKAKFTGKSSATGDLETVAGSKIACTATKVSGTISTTTTGSATFTFTGCTSSGLKCKTGSEAAGTVVVPVTLTGSTVSKEESKKEKDYLLNEVAEFDIKCSTVDIKVKGSLLIPATPESKLSTTYTFAASGSKGVQTPEIATGSGMEHLQANFASAGFENASLKAEELETTFEEAVAFI